MLLRALSFLNFFTRRSKIRSLYVLFTFNFFVVIIFFLYPSFNLTLFAVRDIGYSYFFFLIVAGWGYQPERIKASYAIIFLHYDFFNPAINLCAIFEYTKPKNYIQHFC